MIWLKKDRERFIFHAIIPALYTFWRIFFLVNLKYLYIHYAWMSNMKKQKSTEDVKVKKMVVLVKTSDHYHYKFPLFQLSCKIVKEFQTKI